MQISFSKYYIYISNVDCDKINMISWKKKTQTTCDFVTKEAESHEDRKEKKKRKKEWQSEAGDSHRLSAGNQALCIIPTQQLSSDGAWCNRWICYWDMWLLCIKTVEEETFPVELVPVLWAS